MSIINSSRKYFNTFSNKDLLGLEELFSKDVRLRDWETEAVGLEEVLKANKTIFESVDSIKVDPLRIYNEKNIIIAELKIDVDKGKDVLLVVDVIEYDNTGKICSIRAYKG